MTKPHDRQPQRVFIGLTEIAGYYRNLTQGFVELGVEATMVDLSGNPFGYRTDHTAPAWIRSIENILVSIRGGEGQGVSVRKLVLYLVRSILKPPIALWAISRYDLFVFGFRSSFFAHFELVLLRLLGKKSIFIFNGSDLRPPYLNGQFISRAGPIPAKKLIRRTYRMKRSLRRIERWADVVIAHPPTALLLERPFVQWLDIGIPYRIDATPTSSSKITATVRVVHAPSNPEAKGTDLVRESIREAQSHGLDIEYVELVGTSNADVLAALSDCDFVVDQVYSDTPMAGLATEAAAVGRPSIVGGYELGLLRHAVADSAFPPSFTCLPEDLGRAILRLASDRERCELLGKEAHSFVLNRWTPRTVAARVLDTVSKQPERWSYSEWRHEPFHLGWGISRSRARESLRAVLAAGGADSLCVADARTRDALIALAHSEDEEVAGHDI